MKYTKEDLYEGMLLEWSHEYKITEFDINKPKCRLIGVNHHFDSPWSISLIIENLNSGSCKELSKRPEIQYEIY